jgi:hypothetical protein
MLAHMPPDPLEGGWDGPSLRVGRGVSGTPAYGERHSGEGRNPVFPAGSWTPACAGVTGKRRTSRYVSTYAPGLPGRGMGWPLSPGRQRRFSNACVWGTSFRRRPESSISSRFLDPGMRRGDEKDLKCRYASVSALSPHSPIKGVRGGLSPPAAGGVLPFPPLHYASMSAMA